MICRVCEIEKCKSEFYKNDKTCKECRRSKVKANRIAKSEYYKEYDRKRASNPDRVKARKEYAKTEEGKEAHNRAQRKWLDKNPKKRKAHIITGNAIRNGNLIKQPCEACGTKELIVAHHDDYDSPLVVRWLCEDHHKQWHTENGEGKNALLIKRLRAQGDL